MTKLSKLSSSSSLCKDISPQVTASTTIAAATAPNSDCNELAKNHTQVGDHCIVDEADISDDEEEGEESEESEDDREVESEDDEDEEEDDEDDDDEDDEDDDDEDDDDEDADVDSDDILDPGQHYFHLTSNDHHHHHHESLISNNYHNHHQYNNHLNHLSHNHIIHNQLHLSAAGEELCENNNITDQTIIASHCGIDQQQLLATTPNTTLASTNAEANSGDLLDNERIVEVTRKLVRNTERDPDRDLRKQVLLKTAIKKLPHFMDYNRYDDTLDQSFQCQSMSQQAYYEHDSQPKFYQSVQPNAIQMSTTGLRMLDLNDHDSTDINNMGTIKQQESQLQLQDSEAQLHHQQHNHSLDESISQSYEQTTTSTATLTTSTPTTTTTTVITSPEHHPEYCGLVPNQNQSQYHDGYNQMQPQGTHETTYNNHYETNTTITPPANNSHNSTTTMTPTINRHTTLENLYQPTTMISVGASDINENIKDARVPIAFQLACEVCDFTCAPDDNDEANKKSFEDNLSTNDYYSRPAGKVEFACATDQSSEISELGINDIDNRATLMSMCSDVIDSRDHDNNSDSSSSSHSSSSTDDSVNSIASQSIELSDEVNGTSFLETTLDSTGHYYHSSHDSGVSLFSTKSNKRSSSAIGLDDDMEVDHLTDLSDRSPMIGTNNQYKKLRKREIID